MLYHFINMKFWEQMARQSPKHFMATVIQFMLAENVMEAASCPERTECLMPISEYFYIREILPTTMRSQKFYKNVDANMSLRRRNNGNNGID